MDEYRFAIDVNHLGTGKSYRKGQIVPKNIPNIESLIASKAICMVSKEIPADDYTEMSYKALGDLMDERGLEFERSKEARIKALLESDK